MKKMLAIVCAIAVFVSSFAGALFFTVATEPVNEVVDTATMPTVKDSEGKKIKLYPDTDLTGLGIAASDAVTVVKNTSSLPLTSLYATATGAYTYFDGVKSVDHKGIVMYVEIPDIGPVKYNDGTSDLETDQFRFGVTVLGYEEAAPETGVAIYDYTYGGGWYSMPVGDSQWTAEDKEYYGIQLEYGFKGYVYIPFSSFAVEGHKFTDTMIVKGIAIRNLTNTDDVFADNGKVEYGKVTAEAPIVYSLPIFIKNDGTTDTPATDKLIIDGENAYLDARLVAAADTTLDVTTATVSYNGTADGSAAAKGLRYLKGAQSALTRNLGTIIKSHRTYNDEFGGVNAAGRGYFTDVAFSDIGAGVMVHVDIPKLDGNQTVTFSFVDSVKGNTRWVDTAVGNTTWYLLPDGATQWVEKGASDWHNSNAVIVGDGSEAFSGYVFIPKNVINNYSTGIETLSEVRVGVAPWRYSNKDPKTQDINISVSAVSIISKFNADSTLAYADTGALVDLATGEVVRTDYQSAKPFYGYATVNDTNTYLTAKAAALKALALHQMPAEAGVHVGMFGTHTYEYIPSISPLSDSASLEFSGSLAASRGAIAQLDITATEIGDTTGFLMYIETEGQLSLGFANAYNKTAGGAATVQYGYARSFYYLADGASAWATTTAQTPVNGTSQLPEDFEGYIYVPYASTSDEVSSVYRIVLYGATATSSEYTLRVSNPMLATFTEENAGLIKYNGATETQNMFSGEYYVPVTAETEATYVEYDYSNYNIMNVGVTELDGDVTVGTALPNTALTSGPTEGATLEAVASKLAISDYPSFKLSTGELTSVNYQFDLNEDTATGGKHIMTYIELPEGKSATLKTSWNVHKNGSAGYGSQYGNKVYILQAGETAWTALTVSAYNYELPASFKGYVRYDLANLNLAGALAGTTVDETYSVYQANYTFSAFEAGIDIYVSAPIIVDEITTETTPIDVAFVNGDTTVAKNIFTAVDFVPSDDDTSSDESLSEESSSDESSSEEASSDISSDESSSEEVSSDVSSEEAPDSFVSATTGKLSEIVDGAGAYTSSFALINSVTPLNNKQSVSITPVARYIANGADAAANKVAIFNYSESTAMADVEGFMFYVDVSANTDANKPVNLFIKNHAALNGGSGANVGVFGWNCIANTAGRTPTVYLLADDGVSGTTWTAQALPTDRNDTTANAYGNIQANSGINLPAGFKGYIYIPTDCYQLNTTSFQSIVVFMSASVTLSNDKYYISAPMIVDGFDTISTYFEGDTAKVNLDTNYIFPAGDDTSSDESSSDEVSSDISSSESSSEEASSEVSSDTSSDTSSDDTPSRPTDEPDYDLPKYTGTAPDYTGYSISNVWVARLNEKVFVGYPFEGDSGVTNGNYEVIGSIAPITNYPSLKVTATGTSVTVKHYVDATKTSGATAALYYVEAPADKSIKVSFRVNAYKEGGGNAYGNNYSRAIYALAEGSTEWTSIATSAYYATLPAGFKGYIRQDYKDLAQINGEADVSTVSAYYISLLVTDVVANDEFKISAPILMDATSTIHAQTAAFVEGDVAARNLFNANFVLPGDASLGEIRIPKPEVEPDYSMPKYTGSTLDYTGYSISNTWAARVNEDVFIGYPLSGNLSNNSTFEGEYEFIESIAPITKYPSLKLTVKPEKTSVYAAIYTSEATSSGATSAMYYVELPEGKTASISIKLNFHKAGGGNLYSNNFNKVVYILPEGATEWTEVSVSDYYAQLPAGFKGYVRQDYKFMSGPPTAEDTLYSANVYFSGLIAGDSVNVSAPILLDVTSDIHAKTAVFVEGDKAARDLFTADFVLPGDESLGEKRIPKPEVEPDYDLPYYTGAKPDYSEYTIAKAWVARVNEDVFIGYPLSGLASSNSSFIGNYEFINSITPITKYPSLKLTAKNTDPEKMTTTVNAAVYLNTDTSKGATSAMYYVELPEGQDATMRIALNFYSDRTNSGRIYASNYQQNMYILEEGDTEWKAVKAEAYYIQLPEGFKGYVRQDFANMSYKDTDEARTSYYPNAEDTCYQSSITFGELQEGEVVNVSAPIFVDKITAAHVVTAAFINEDTAVRNFFTGKHVMPGDASLGEPKQPIPEEEPNYDLPHYTGEQPDYTNYKFSNYWVAKLNDKVFVGYDMPEKAATATGANLFAIDSITPITKYPSIKVTATGSTASLGFNPKAESASGANSALFYIEAPADKEITVSYRLNFKKDGEKNLYGNNYSRNIYIMSADDKNWKSVKAEAYNVTLPAGFKGYIRQDYSDLNVAADETWTLYYEGLIIGGLAEGDVVNVSAPILADFITSDRLPNGAYIEGDPKAPRELFTGKFLLPGDKDLGGPTVEPDYKIPHYTGEAINYGNIDIMNVRTAKLNGSIIIGRTLSEDIYKINTGKGEATQSLVGISNYPMLKLTGMEIEPDTRITVATGNYDWQANLGAKSVMFYVKIPEGQDTNFAISWSWHHEDGRTTGAYNYNGTAYLMAKDQTKWKAVDISKYWIDLPAGYEGYIRFDLKDIWCVYPYDEDGNIIYKLDENGNKVYKDPDNKNLGFQIDSSADHYSLKDGKWGLQTTYIQLSNSVAGAKTDAIISSPILIDEFISLQTIQNIAYVDGDTKAARNIFTGAVMKLGDFDATAGAEPNYDIPFYTGKEENYDKLSIMKTRTSRLNYAVLIGEEFSPTALTSGAETLAMPVKSIHPLSNYPAIEMTNLGTGAVNVTMKTSPEQNAGATGIMFYVKAPADTETGIRFSFSFKNVKDGRTTGAYNYSGNAYIMDKNATEWSYVNISKYYVSLPAGFEGYVRYDLAKIYCVYSYDEDGKARTEYVDGKLKILTDGEHYYLDQDWGLALAYTFMSGIPQGEKGYISAPIMVDEIDENSTSPRATFHNGEKFARDIFTGQVLKRSDIDKPVQKGDTLKKLPDPTTELKAKVTDKTKLGEGKATISWAAFDGAAKYVIRVFKNLQGATGLVYNCVGVYETTETTFELTGLAKNTRYSVVVYALDADGNEIAIYDYVTVSTVGATSSADDEPDDTDAPAEEDKGMPLWAWIVIGAVAVVILAGGAVVSIIVIKKKKAKAA